MVSKTAAVRWLVRNGAQAVREALEAAWAENIGLPERQMSLELGSEISVVAVAAKLELGGAGMKEAPESPPPVASPLIAALPLAVAATQMAATPPASTPASTGVSGAGVSPGDVNQEAA